MTVWLATLVGSARAVDDLGAGLAGTRIRSNGKKIFVTECHRCRRHRHHRSRYAPSRRLSRVPFSTTTATSATASAAAAAAAATATATAAAAAAAAVAAAAAIAVAIAATAAAAVAVSPRRRQRGRADRRRSGTRGAAADGGICDSDEATGGAGSRLADYIHQQGALVGDRDQISRPVELSDVLRYSRRRERQAKAQKTKYKRKLKANECE